MRKQKNKSVLRTMNSMQKVLKGATVLTSIACLNAFAEVKVNINIDNPEHHMATVTLNLPEHKGDYVEVKLPAWRTGRYEILDLANSIRQFDADDSAGNDLDWQKIDKSTWRITNPAGGPVSVSYQVYANQLGSRTRHIDDSHAFLDASAVVMYTDDTRDDQFVVDLTVPQAWRSVSGLSQGNNPHQFIAKDFDVLIDSPIETGINELHKFEVDGIDYELVIWGKGNYDSQKMVDDLKVMVQQAKHIWSDYPFSRYVFMVHATSGARGATEHLNSTIIQRSRYSFSDRKDYLGFLATAAHEFVHTWNVKQYRPDGLVPYDYQQENYSPLIWLSEGSTSYLQYQLLTRGDLMTTKEFMDDIAKRIAGYNSKQGRNVQSIAQASFDTWISAGGDFASNNSVNIYSEGYLASWLLDFDILEKTSLKKSYRDVHSELYNNYKIPHGFTETDVKAALKTVTGESYNKWWQENIHGLPQPDFSALLAKAGLELSTGEKTKAWTGIRTRKADNGLKIVAVERNSPAWNAGFTTDDIIVAVDDLRMADSDMSKRLKNFKPEQDIKVTFFRRDQLNEKVIKLGSKPAKKLSVKAMKAPTEQQKAFFTAWSGLAFPE